MKSQILNTKNAKGGNMKAYTIADYSNGKPKSARNAANWVTPEFRLSGGRCLRTSPCVALRASLTTCNSQLQSHARITETFYNNWNSRKRNHA